MSAPDFDDPGADFVRGSTRTGLMVAAVAAQQMARLRADQQRRRASLVEADARRLDHQMRAEASIARSEIASTVGSNWLDLAEPQAIGDAWVKARQWRDYDPETFGPWVEQLREGAERRFGVDLEDTATAEEAVRALEQFAVAEREHDDRTPEEQRTAADQEQRDLVDEVAAAGVAYTTRDDLNADRRDAEQLDGQVRGQEQVDQDVVDEAVVDQAIPYDSPERRTHLEQRAISAGVDPDVAAGRARAAAAQAQPATQATAQPAAKKAAKAKPSRGRGPSRDLQR